MTTLKEPDPTCLKGSDKEDDTARTPERRHVDALLRISEEAPPEPEPHEYHCASGWEDAVRGWARAAPLSCIFSSQKPHRKAKHKDADSPSLPDAERSASVAGHHFESRMGSSNGVKKSMPLNQQTGCCNALQAGASGWMDLSALQKSPLRLSLEERTEENTPSQPHHLSFKHSVPEHGSTKPHKHSSKLVPIKNFTFLPAIKSPQLNPKFCDHLCSSTNASDEEALCEHVFLIDKKGATGTRRGPGGNAECPTYSAALLPKCPICQHNLNLFSSVSVPVPKRYRVPVSSKRDAAHCSSFPMGKSLTPGLRCTAAVGAHAPAYLFS